MHFKERKVEHKKRGWKTSEIKRRKIIDGFFFLLIKPGFVLQAPALRVKRKAIKRLPARFFFYAGDEYSF